MKEIEVWHDFWQLVSKKKKTQKKHMPLWYVELILLENIA